MFRTSSFCSIIVANNLELLKSHVNDSENASDNIMINTPLYYPLTGNDRKSFKNPKTGRIVTEFQFKVLNNLVQLVII